MEFQAPDAEARPREAKRAFSCLRRAGAEVKERHQPSRARDVEGLPSGEQSWGQIAVSRRTESWGYVEVYSEYIYLLYPSRQEAAVMPPLLGRSSVKASPYHVTYIHIHM